MKRLAIVVVALGLWACGHHPAATPRQQPPPPPAPADAAVSAKLGVALTVTPADAEVEIDGTSYGVASALPPVIELKPGLYTLVVKRDGYTPYRVEFSLSDKTESFAVHLDPVKR
jgi:hypothetical protein